MSQQDQPGSLTGAPRRPAERSNPGKDLRIRRTRKLLWQALLGLLETRRWEDTSVGDICQAAMVHRTTFYKHFENKEDLLEQGFSAMVGETLDELGFPPPPDRLAGPPPVDFVRIFLEHVQAYKGLYAFVFSRQSSTAYTYTIRNIFADLIQSRMESFMARHQLPLPPGFPPLALMANYQAGALLAIVAWWFESGQEIPMEELASQVNRLMDIRRLLD